MAINKVVYGNDTLVDLTEDSVSANNLLEGETAHDRSGNPVTGTAKQGHIVQDTNGTDMTQRSKVQFVGVYTEDDATNGRTKVNIVREMTSAQMQALTTAQKKGFIRTTDEPDNPISDFVSRETIRTGVVLERYGKYRRLAMRNVSPTSSNGLMTTLSEEDRPHQFSTSIVLGVLSNTLYPCYTNVNATTGDIQAYYFNSGTTTDSPAPTTMKIYGDIDWLVD